MKAHDHMGLRTWIEIDTKAIGVNYRTFRKLIPKNVKIMGVVKSNAYGHGLAPFAKELEKLDVYMLAVDSLVEALSLQETGIKKTILVLGYTLPELFSKAVGKNIHLTISSVEGLRVFLKSSNARTIPIHLKVDTGMHRQGFLFSDCEKVFKLLNGKKINIAGLYTHFATAKNISSRDFTIAQIAQFGTWQSTVRERGHDPILHTGATGGSLYFPESHFEMVRIGAGLYGFWPEDKNIETTPVLTWKTIISEVKIISAGEGVGYDLTHKAKETTHIAVCPVGYWHGYPRSLSNKSFVLVKGRRARVLGRVSMDMIVIDVTNIPHVKVGNEVVLIGKSGKEEIKASELAVLADTSAYEILTRLNPLIHRIYR